MRNLGQFGPARSQTSRPDLPYRPANRAHAFEMVALARHGGAEGHAAEIRERLVEGRSSRPRRDPGFQLQAVKVFAPLRFLTPAQFACRRSAPEAQLSTALARAALEPTSSQETQHAFLTRERPHDLRAAASELGQSASRERLRDALGRPAGRVVAGDSACAERCCVPDYLSLQGSSPRAA